VAFLDWFSRYVVSLELDYTLEIDFVLEALDRALRIAHPEIVNSDQGSQLPAINTQTYCLKIKSK
jgi:putative transposase